MRPWFESLAWRWSLLMRRSTDDGMKRRDELKAKEESNTRFRRVHTI